MGKKRERLEVIYDILKAISNSKHVKPTRLLYASNLSPQMFKEYISELVSKGLVVEEVIKGKRLFSLSDKGYSFLEKYKVIVEFVEGFGLWFGKINKVSLDNSSYDTNNDNTRWNDV